MIIWNPESQSQYYRELLDSVSGHGMGFRFLFVSRLAKRTTPYQPLTSHNKYGTSVRDRLWQSQGREYPCSRDCFASAKAGWSRNDRMVYSPLSRDCFASLRFYSVQALRLRSVQATKGGWSRNDRTGKGCPTALT